MAPTLHHSQRYLTRHTTLRISSVRYVNPLLRFRGPDQLVSSYSTPSKPKSTDESKPPSRTQAALSLVKDLLFGHQPQEKKVDTATPTQTVAVLEPSVRKYIPTETPRERWQRRQNLLGDSRRRSDGASEDSTLDRQQQQQQRSYDDGKILYKPHHRTLLDPANLARTRPERKLEHVAEIKMHSFAQVLTAPTADTPGTTLLLHFDNKRYLIGSMAEGTQRAGVQMGARMVKVGECFVTGRAEWANTGGLIGLILTLADAAASSQASTLDELLRKAWRKAQREGYSDDREKMREIEEQAKRSVSTTLTMFGPPNLNHTMATARRFVFRKGMPLDIHEFRSDDKISSKPRESEKDVKEGEPVWADENIKVWTLPILPQSTSDRHQSSPSQSVSPRKRSIDEVYATEALNGTPNGAMEDLTPDERNYLTVKAVVSEMFNSSWRLDTLYETPLSNVNLPATIFIRNANSNKIEKYTGPLPGGPEPLPDPHIKVLVRKPWPGALVEGLPPTQPAKEAISYIIKNHMQRGKFFPNKAKDLNVEKGRAWAKLTAGESVVNQDGETITPDMVLGEGKEGGGFAVVDLPSADYIENLIARPEWRQSRIMSGVGAIFWICGKHTATDARLHAFMREFQHLEHIVSSPDYCPNNITMDSAAASSVRLSHIDPDRHRVPVHDAETAARDSHPLPNGVRTAARGQIVQLEPSFEFLTNQIVPPLDIAGVEARMPRDVLEEAAKAQEAVKASDEGTQAWIESIPAAARDAEIITLGTGSALPSKYRNVSATLVRVPGWGNVLLDCGENTIGQLKRVFTASEFKELLRDLKMIFISHMHADHQLGTTSVIKAWYEEVHGSQPAVIDYTSSSDKSSTDIQNRLAIISEPAMQHWLAEYSAVEDFGYSRLAPLAISGAAPHKGHPSSLTWFVSPSELAPLSPSARMEKLAQNVVPASALHLDDIQAVAVRHCHGARAVSITFPPEVGSFKVSYSGDCRPSRAFAQIGQGSTVCIHEATFDDELQGDAEAKNHSTTSEALGVAQQMNAHACVLTHFSQRYQKVPILERNSDYDDASARVPVEAPIEPEEEEDAETAAADPDMNLDVAATFPDQAPADSTGQQYDLPPPSSSTMKLSSSRNIPKDGHSSEDNAPPPQAVKFKLSSDMKVGIAFDYMRVKVRDIAHLEKFTPALLKLFADEDRVSVDGGGDGDGNGKGNGNGKKDKSKNKNKKNITG